jgi:hypothetical protein
VGQLDGKVAIVTGASRGIETPPRMRLDDPTSYWRQAGP